MSKSTAFVLLSSMFAWVGQAQAARTTNPATGLFANTFGNSGSNDIGTLAEEVILTLLILAGTVSIAILIYGGMQYIFSGANEDLAKQGKSRVKNAIIGLIIILLSYTIISVVFSTLSSPPPTP